VRGFLFRLWTVALDGKLLSGVGGTKAKVVTR